MIQASRLCLNLCERFFGLPIDSQAEELVFKQKLNKEYLPIAGLNEFTKASAKLAYGSSSALLDRVGFILIWFLGLFGEILRFLGAFLQNSAALSTDPCNAFSTRCGKVSLNH